MRRPLVLAMLLACGTDAGAPAPPPPLSPENGAHLALSIQQGPSSIVSGGRIDVLVAVARDGQDAFYGDVVLTLAPADGFSAAPVTVARIASTATFSLYVAPERKHGSATLRIAAKSRDQKASGDVALPLLVRGAAGALDTSFGTGGVFVLGEQAAEATGIALQPDGKIVLGGRIGSDAAVVRLTAEGQLDGAFGGAGRARVPVAGLVSTHDVVMATGAAIVLGGTGATSFLARFTEAGAVDASFGTQGVLVEPSQRRSRALVVVEGNMYLGGQPAAPADKDGMSVIRLLPSGAPEPSWGKSGEVTVALPAGICALGDGECFLSAMGPKVGGKMTLCGSRGDSVTVRELFTSGVEDRNFDLTTPASVLSRCTAIVNNTPSDAFAAGARDANVFAIVHLLTSPTGGPQVNDPKFGPVVVPAEAGLGVATRLAIGGPSLLVASVDATPGGGPSQIALARMNVFSSKQLDTTFGGGKGYVTTPIGTTPGFSRALVVQGDGRVIVAGTNGDMVAVRYWP